MPVSNTPLNTKDTAVLPNREDAQFNVSPHSTAWINGVTTMLARNTMR